MLGSAVNDTMREMMAAVKRDWNRSHVTISSTGSANAYVLTYANAPTLTHGMIFSFKASFACTGASTANINALGAKAIRQRDGVSVMLGSDIVVNQHVVLSYDSALDVLIMLSPRGTMAIDGRGADVASATTTDIWTNTGSLIHITGTTTITSLGTAPYPGARKTITFDGALTLTHGANLSLPGSANITTAADDMAFVYADTTTQFDVLYFKKSGVAIVGAWDLLQTATASASATIDLETGIGATYDDYVIIADGVRPATDNALLYCRLKIAGAYAAANYAYHADVSSSSAATYSGIASGSAGQIQICSALDNTTAASNLCFAMHVFNVNSTSLSRSVTWSGTNRLTGEVARADGSGDNSGAGAVTGVRFLMDTGNISVGTFRLYGVRK